MKYIMISLYLSFGVESQGEWFGESALLGSTMKATRVTALEPVSLLSLQNDKYRQFSDEYGLSVSVKEELIDEKSCSDDQNSPTGETKSAQVRV